MSVRELGNPLGLPKKAGGNVNKPTVICIPGSSAAGVSLTGFISGLSKYRFMRLTLVGAGGSGFYSGGAGGGAAATDILPAIGNISLTYNLAGTTAPDATGATSTLSYNVAGAVGALSVPAGGSATSTGVGSGVTPSGGFTNFPGGDGGPGVTSLGAGGGGGAASAFGKGGNGGQTGFSGGDSVNGGGGGGAGNDGISTTSISGAGGGGIGCDGGNSPPYLGGKTLGGSAINIDADDLFYKSAVSKVATVGGIAWTRQGGRGGVGGGGGGGSINNAQALPSTRGAGGQALLQIELWP